MARLFRIALLGNPGSGKTSIGDALIDLAGGERISFAREVKREAARVLIGVDRVQPDDETERKYIARMEDPATKDEYRSLLQMWGTNFRRSQDPNYWVHQAAKHIVSSSPNQVVDDCRFPNEQELLAGRGFYFVRLEDGPTTRPMTEEQAAHESEQYWRDFPVDLTLPYEAGPVQQAVRIIHALTAD